MGGKARAAREDDPSEDEAVSKSEDKAEGKRQRKKKKKKDKKEQEDPKDQGKLRAWSQGSGSGKSGSAVKEEEEEQEEDGPRKKREKGGKQEKGGDKKAKKGKKDKSKAPSDAEEPRRAEGSGDDESHVAAKNGRGRNGGGDGGSARSKSQRSAAGSAAGVAQGKRRRRAKAVGRRSPRQKSHSGDDETKKKKSEPKNKEGGASSDSGRSRSRRGAGGEDAGRSKSRRSAVKGEDGGRRRRRKRRKSKRRGSKSKSRSGSKRRSRSRSRSRQPRASRARSRRSRSDRRGGPPKRGRGGVRRRQASRSRSRSRSRDGKRDMRPMVERVKGGVKLFVGRLPVEATQAMLHSAFAEFGEVLEVFLIDSTNAMKGARCAFVRLGSLEAAERSIREMHETLVLVPDRKELGPIQVAFAKGEALRFGLGAQREQLSSRPPPQPPGPQVLGTGPAKGPLVFDPESLTKELLVEFIKECQRTGGQTFKEQWWAYCDSGKGGIRDYDPLRHSFVSLRQFFSPQQQIEWDNHPWFRRAIHRALKQGSGGRKTKGVRRRVRVRRRRRSSEGSGSDSSSDSSSGAQRRRKADAAAAAAVANMATNAARIGAVVSPPRRALARPRRDSTSQLALPNASGFSSGRLPPPPIPGMRAVPPPFQGPPLPHGPPPSLTDRSSLLSKLAPSSCERNPALEAFLARLRIPPAVAYLMMRLSREQAATIIANTTERLRQAAAGELPPGRELAAPEAVLLSVLRSFGVPTAQLASKGPQPDLGQTFVPVNGGALGQAASGPGQGVGEGLNLGMVPGLQSLDGLLGPAFEESLPIVGGDGQEESGGRMSHSDNVVRVKNLDRSTSEEDIRELFGRHGSIVALDVLKDKQGAGRGLAIVTFQCSEEVDSCIKQLNFTKPWGRALVVERPPRPGNQTDLERPVDAESGAAGKDSSGRVAQAEQRQEAQREKAGKESKKAKQKASKRGRSRSSSDDSSGWSKYTVGRGRKKDRKRDDSRSSSYEYGSCCTSFSELDNMPMGWPGGPFPMPGMPPLMVPPPWEAPPPWAAPPPPMFDEKGYLAYDMEDAERQLRHAERLSKREARRQRHEPWEDHPARVKRRQRKERGSSSSGSRGRGRRKGRHGRRGHGSGSDCLLEGGGFPMPPGMFPPPPHMFGWQGMPPPGFPPFGPPPGPPGFPPPPDGMLPPWLSSGPPPGVVCERDFEELRPRARRARAVDEEPESESEYTSADSDVEVLSDGGPEVAKKPERPIQREDDDDEADDEYDEESEEEDEDDDEEDESDEED